jgi:hypothetical protein
MPKLFIYQLTHKCFALKEVLFQTVSQIYTHKNLLIYAATQPNWPQRCILTDDSDCFNNSNFSKAQKALSLVMVIKPKHVGTFLM